MLFLPAIEFPIKREKVRGGWSTQWIDYFLDYHLSEAEISEHRSNCLIQWVDRTPDKGGVSAPEFHEMRGRFWLRIPGLAE